MIVMRTGRPGMLVYECRELCVASGLHLAEVIPTRPPVIITEAVLNGS
jgi:hypothetical protein